MGRKRSIQGSVDAAREFIRRNDVFHDPTAIERGGTGLEYVPENVVENSPPRKGKRRRSTQSQTQS